MSDIPGQAKATPGRQRQARNGKSAAQKAYASENDAAMSDHNRAPHTPNKTGHGSPAPGSMSAAQANSNKSRNKNKAKGNKNTQPSPDAQQQGRSTPPHRPGSTKSGIATAFAGATFHASPAPSALPMPSFLAKSSGDSPSGGRLKNIDPQYSPPATDNEAHTPSYSSSAPKARESPLDFMFRAQRQERGLQTQPTQNLPPHGSPSQFSNYYHHQSPQTAPQHGRSSAKQSHGIDRAELDGTPGFSIGPAFSTPYHERINAAKAARNGPQQQHSPLSNSPAQNTSSDDATAALKKFLFGGGNGQAGPKPALSSAPPAHGNSIPPQPPSQMDGAGYGRGGNIQAMENDLRRILKLDSST
ncbi:hypothetical protein K4F52_008927 [Lecanicillium sp. MT-2017a]|nr:hypothetical protein K4F52_008927 [Lecanicillium sp. MT-2017a]